MSVRLLRLSEVRARVPFSRAAIYAKIKKGEFPAPVNIGSRAVAWPSDAIDAFIAQCIDAAAHKGKAAQR